MGNSMQFQRTRIEILYKGFFRMEKWFVRHALFGGGMSPEIARELIVRHAASCVLLYDPVLESVVMIEQFRAPALEGGRPWLLELVAGLLDKEDEPPEDVARREALEEAGLTLKRIEKIAEYWSSPGASNEKIHLYVGEVDATGAGGIHGLVDEGEDIRVEVIDVAAIETLLASGRVCNAAAIIALQWFQLHSDRLRQTWSTT